MEQVVLVDEQNREIGLADKAKVHTTDTPLHRGFSLWLFNSRKEILLTQRALTKKTFAGVWTNTLCGHPGPGETVIEAARRRLNNELGMLNCHSRESGNPDLREKPGSPIPYRVNRSGMTSIKITEAAPYKYKFADKNGIVENEICPILVGYINCEEDDNFLPNHAEIEDWQWLPWQEFLDNIKEDPKQYSPWCVEEAKILENCKFLEFL